MNKLTFLGALALIAASCTTTRPVASDLEFPDPYQENGVHVQLDGVVKSQSRAILAFSGVAENRSGHDLGMILLRLDLFDATGAKVAEARAFSGGLKKDGVWRFQALVIGQLTRVPFKRLEPGRILVMNP